MVTVVIPIHNSEKYLKECMESALSQSFQDIEILCIDSGSTDGSGKIVKNLQNKDSRIIAIYDTNTSYGHKINVGIDKARGEYIVILESDDRLKPDMIEKLYQVAKAYNVDLADADFSEFFTYRGREIENNIHKYTYPEKYNHLINYEDGLKRDIVNNGIWTGLYKKSFLVEQNIRLNESAGASYQDLSFLFLTSLLAKRVYHVNVPLYQYRIDNIGSSVKDDNKIFEIVGECEFLKNNLLNRGIKSKTDWIFFYIRKYNAFYWNYCRLSLPAKEIFLETYIKELKQDIKNKAVEREMFDPFLYNRTFLLIDNKEEFIMEATRNSNRSFGIKICESLDKIGNREVVLFGSGVLGKKIMNILLQSGIHIKGVCDNSRSCQGEDIGGVKIVSVKQAVKKFPKAVYFVTSSKYGKQMLEQLRLEGIEENNIVTLGN